MSKVTKTNNLSITSSEVINNYNQLIKRVSEPATAQALNVVKKNQRNYEEKLIATTAPCNSLMLNALRDHLSGLKSSNLDEYLSNQFQNPAAMKAIMCTVNAVFYTSPYDVGSLYLNNRIRMYIKNLQQIGKESTEGYVLTGDFENAKDMLIVKAARSPVHDTLLHELIVGLHGTNHLRKHIPNFVYVYGGFRSSPPLVDPESKRVVTYCLSTENPVNYVLFENLGDVPSLQTYLQKCSGQEFLNIYMQILYALHTALKVIDFTHYDLHCNNVLLRLPEQSCNMFQIPYETELGKEYITTNVIPTIIDYGYAQVRTKDVIDSAGHVLVTGQHLGRSDYVPFSVYAYRSWIMHDLYKLLMFSLSAAYKYNNQNVVFVASKIFRFFNSTEDVESAIRQQEEIKFPLPLTKMSNTLTINNFATYIRKVCDCSFINGIKNNLPILNCEKICLDSDTILTNIGINPNDRIATPDNILEFHDIAVRLQNQGRENEKQDLASRFNYTDAMNKHLSEMTMMIDELINLKNQLHLVDIATMTIGQVLTYEVMNTVRTMYVAVGAIIDKTVELQFYYDIGKAVAISFKSNYDTMNAIINKFDKEVRPSLNEIKRIFASNDNYLNKIESDAIVKASLQRDERLKWYWNGRKLFDIAFGRVIVEFK